MLRWNHFELSFFMLWSYVYERRRTPALIWEHTINMKCGIIYSLLDGVWFELARYLHQVETDTSSAHLACHEILSWTVYKLMAQCSVNLTSEVSQPQSADIVLFPCTLQVDCHQKTDSVCFCGWWMCFEAYEVPVMVNHTVWFLVTTYMQM